MDEARCSVNFRLYSKFGVEHQFTLRSDVGPKELMGELDVLHARLDSDGYTRERLSGGNIREQALDGVVRGSYKDSKTGNFEECYYFYGTGKSQFKVGIIYPEARGKLPEWVVQRIAQFNYEPYASAPEKDDAIARKKYIALGRPLIGIFERRLDHNNEPVLVENPKTGQKVEVWRLVSFKSPSAEGETQPNTTIAPVAPTPAVKRAFAGSPPPPPDDNEDFPF